MDEVNYEHKLCENVELEIAKYKVETHWNFNGVIRKWGIGYKKLELLTKLIFRLTIGINWLSKTIINDMLFIYTEVDTKSWRHGSMPLIRRGGL